MTKTARILAAAGLFTLAAPTTVPEAHAQQLGTVHFPTSCNEAAQRRFDRGPEFPDRPVVAGALRIKSGEHHEERRGVDAAVVAPEGNLSQGRHLAAAHFVHDLAGLGVVFRIDRLCSLRTPRE